MIEHLGPSGEIEVIVTNRTSDLFALEEMALLCEVDGEPFDGASGAEVDALFEGARG